VFEAGMMIGKGYRRVMPGRKSAYARQCHEGGFIGGDWGFDQDLTGQFGDEWRGFGEKFKPVYLAAHPEKSKVAAGLACGMLWTICKGMKQGDVVMSPDGEGGYLVGEVASEYYYAPGEILPHRRKVSWFPSRISKSDMSVALLNSTGAIGTVSDILKHADEIERLVGREVAPAIFANDEVIEDPSTFALEKHLEDFLVANWTQTELGRTHDIYNEDGEMIGQQYPSDTGPMDILAISKDRRELLVVELKRGRASDAVMGQVQRYMGYALSELAEEGQTVRGAIIALEDDLRLRRALSVTSNIDFYRYQVSFKLVQA
jgi:restriction system protein